MRLYLATILILALAACVSEPLPPQPQWAQFQQAGPPFPYNSFYCP